MYERALPHLGQSVTVSFLAARVHGTVVAVDQGLDGLEVLTDEDELMRFELLPTTGRFHSGGQIGPRLFFNGTDSN
jgi:hypothetical protein